MPFSISQVPLNLVREHASEGRDPLGVADGLTDPDSVALVERIVSAALSGLTRQQARSIEKDLHAHAAEMDAAMDKITVDLLIHMGMDPLTAFWLATIDNGFNAQNADGLSTVLAFNQEP